MTSNCFLRLRSDIVARFVSLRWKLIFNINTRSVRWTSVTKCATLQVRTQTFLWPRSPEIGTILNSTDSILAVVVLPPASRRTGISLRCETK